MKMLTSILFFTACLLLICSRCQNEYANDAKVPGDYPDDDLEIYDDSTVYEVVEDRDEITVKYGTDDDIDRIIDFYTEMFENSYLLANETDEGIDDYYAEGIGSCYNFEIQAEEPTDDKAKKLFDTIVTVKIQYVDERMDLMDELQGFWLNTGSNGNIFNQLRALGGGVKFEENTFGGYTNFLLSLHNTYVFYLDDSQIMTKNENGITEPYDIIFETIEGIDVLTIIDEGTDPLHHIKLSDDELAKYKDINKTWNSMQGFWCVTGANEEMHEEILGLAYDFKDFYFDMYLNDELTYEKALYEFTDADTFEHEFYDETKTADISFESADGVDVMTFTYDDGVIHFKKSTYEEYMEILENLKPIGYETQMQMQGLWALAGTNGTIYEEYLTSGYAYEYIDNHFNSYAKFNISYENIEYTFTDDNTMEYRLSEGSSAISNKIIFETIEGVEVMTRVVNDTHAHYVQVAYDEFMALKEPWMDTHAQMQGLWFLVGSKGNISDAHRCSGFAYEFADSVFNIYSNFALSADNTEFTFIDEDTIQYVTSGGNNATMDISFETINGGDGMNITENGVEYHYVKTSYDEFVKQEDVLLGKGYANLTWDLTDEQTINLITNLAWVNTYYKTGDDDYQESENKSTFTLYTDYTGTVVHPDKSVTNLTWSIKNNILVLSTSDRKYRVDYNYTGGSRQMYLYRTDDEGIIHTTVFICE